MYQLSAKLKRLPALRFRSFRARTWEYVLPHARWRRETFSNHPPDVCASRRDVRPTGLVQAIFVASGRVSATLA